MGVKSFIANNWVSLLVGTLVIVAIILYYNQMKKSTELSNVNKIDDINSNNANIANIKLVPNKSAREVINKRLDQLCQTQGDIVNSEISDFN